jgi:hypothetical protein
MDETNKTYAILSYFAESMLLKNSKAKNACLALVFLSSID